MKMATLKGASFELSLQVLGYENGDAQDAYDLKWFKCEIVAVSGTFRAVSPCSLLMSELEQLYSDLEFFLQSKSSAEVSFENFEENLSLNAKKENDFTSSVNIKVTDNNPPEKSLTLAASIENHNMEYFKNDIYLLTHLTQSL